MTTERRSNVNRALTRRERRVAVENPEYAAFARRIVRAHGRRVASGDVEALTGLLGLAEEVDRAIGDGVAGLRDGGYSWQEIASRIGISRQAAQQRWGGGHR